MLGSRLRFGLLLPLVSLLVCTGACDEDDPPPAAPTEPEPPPEQPLEPPGPQLELHEWGLVSERAGTGRGAFSHSHGRVRLVDLLGDLSDAPALGESFGTGGLGLTGIGRGGGKPVIYAHLPEGVDEHTFSLRVQVVGGNVVEHWPLVGEPGPVPTVTWTQVRAHRGTCAARVYPGADDPACQTEDEFCEAKHGAENETDDGACLEVGGASFDHLFYRAAMSDAPLPLRIVRADNGTVNVQHRGSAPIPGQLIRVRGSDDAAADGSSPLTLVAMAPPGPGATLTVPVPTEASQLEVPLRAGLTELGMTTDEADAFVRAWEVHLVRGETQRPDMPETLEEPTDALLYWMPQSDIAGHIVLDAGESVTLRRALLVRVGLDYGSAER